MDEGDVRAWFDKYLRALSTRGRGDSDDLDGLLDYYGVPLVVATDGGAGALTTADEVIAFARQQVDGMRAAKFDRIEAIDSDITVLNAASALHVASFARQRADSSEIGRFGVTYLITSGPAGFRISAAAIHAP